ncbi:hypothetical protein GCM10020295_75410 [Streptomyces cinereospinus]
MRVDQGAAQAELGHGPLQLGRRRLRVLQRQRGEAGEPGGMLRDHFREQVVDRRGLPDGHGGVRLGLDTGRVEGEHLYVEAGRVHLGQALTGEVEHPPGRLPPLVRLGDRGGSGTVRRQFRSDEVFFKTDGPHEPTRFTNMH